LSHSSLKATWLDLTWYYGDDSIVGPLPTGDMVWLELPGALEPLATKATMWLDDETCVRILEATSAPTVLELDAICQAPSVDKGCKSIIEALSEGSMSTTIWRPLPISRGGHGTLAPVGLTSHWWRCAVLTIPLSIWNHKVSADCAPCQLAEALPRMPACIPCTFWIHKDLSGCISLDLLPRMAVLHCTHHPKLHHLQPSPVRLSDAKISHFAAYAQVPAYGYFTCRPVTELWQHSKKCWN